MSNTSGQLIGSAFAVTVLGHTAEELARLDDDSVLAGMTLISNHERHLQAYKIALAAEIARRSSHDLGYSGLARKNGSATPAELIQSLTGDSLAEANKLALLGQNAVDDSQSPIIEAASAGKISVDAADAIRRGLGASDAAVTPEQLSDAADELISDAGTLSPELLLRKARHARGALDLDAIEREQKSRSDSRYSTVWRKNGMVGGRWALPEEDGGGEIYTAMKLLGAKMTNGPRFVEKAKDARPTNDNSATTAAEPAGSARSGAVQAGAAHAGAVQTGAVQTGAVQTGALDIYVDDELSSTADAEVKAANTQGSPSDVEDTRTYDQVMADGFAQIFRNGLAADPTIVPGAGRAAVRVIVEDKVLKERNGSALLEDSLSHITFSKLEEYLCEGGTVGVLFDDDGNIDVGREQRIFTTRQRTALGVRDGGCRFPGCNKPPSWTEAHHIDFWARDGGKTDIENGILLCRYHHMLVHNNDWEILRRDGMYWLRKPESIDPSRRLIEMPSKNPLVAAMQLRRSAEQNVAHELELADA